MPAPATTSASRRLSRFWDGLLFASLGFALLVWQSKNPLHSGWSIGWQLLGGGLLVAGVLVMVWRWRATRYAALGLAFAGAALFTLPGRAVNQPELRSRYVAALKSFDETPYVWGGESTRGIDCSGLARRAWREALWQEGLATMNGALLRAALGQWLTDASARDLAQGNQGATIPLGTGDTTLEKFDPAKVLPGDLAITTDGVHMLVALGGTDWIEADPGLGRVLVLEICCDESPWFTRPVRLYRWALLQ
jgi:hypothetical protein